MNTESHDHIYHQTDHFLTPPLNANASLRCSFAECRDLTFNHLPNLLRHTRLKHPDSLHPIQLKAFTNVRRPRSSNHVLKIFFTSKIKCSLCDKWVLRQDGLEIHVMQEHTVKEVVIGGFDECTRTFKSGKELEKNRGIHQQQPTHQANKLNESTNDKSLKSAQLLLVDSGSNEELIDEANETNETNETNESDEALLEEIVLEKDKDLDEHLMDEKDFDGEELDQTKQSLEEMDLMNADLDKHSMGESDSDEEADEKTDSVGEDLQSQQLEIQQQTITELTNAKSKLYAKDIKNCNNLNQPSITTLDPEIPILINANPLPIYSLSYTLFQHPINYIYNFDPTTNVLMEPNSIQNNNSNIKTFQSNQPVFTEIHHPMSQQIDQSNIELIPMQFTNAMPVQQQIFVSNIDCQQSIKPTQPMLYRDNFIQMTNDQVNRPTHLLLQTNQLPSIVVPSSIYQFSANQSNPNATQSTLNLISAQSIVHLNQPNPPTEQSQPEHQATQLNKLINQPSVNCPECGKSYKNKNSLTVHRSTVHSKQLAIVCEVSGCGETVKTKINLDCHYRWAHNGINWPCRQCKLFKKDKDLMEKHFRIYHEIDLYPPKSELWDQLVQSKCQLENIILNSSTSILLNSTSIQSNSLPNNQTNSFFNHILPNPPTILSSSPSRSSMLPPSSVIKTKKKRIYRKISNRVISTNQLPGQDAPRFICNEDNCGKTFTYGFTMKRHQKIVHQGESFTHRCTWVGCGLEFSGTHQLRKHREQAHTGVTVYKCDYPECNKTTTDKGNMTKHRQLVHEKALIMCKYANCGQMFKHYGTMMRHRRMVHTAGGKYKCEVEDCGLGFESVAFLRRHCEQKHKIGNAHL